MSTLATVKNVGDITGKTLANLYLSSFQPTNSFTIMIVNNMAYRRMINPVIYLPGDDAGEIVAPPPFIIPAVKKIYDGAMNIITIENGSPAG